MEVKYVKNECPRYGSSLRSGTSKRTAGVFVFVVVVVEE
jgi:hypothetical protein